MSIDSLNGRCNNDDDWNNAQRQRLFVDVNVHVPAAVGFKIQILNGNKHRINCIAIKTNSVNCWWMWKENNKNKIKSLQQKPIKMHYNVKKSNGSHLLLSRWCFVYANIEWVCTYWSDRHVIHTAYTEYIVRLHLCGLRTICTIEILRVNHLCVFVTAHVNVQHYCYFIFLFFFSRTNVIWIPVLKFYR